MSALEDSVSFMSIKCIADANPPAAIRWYKNSIIMTRNNFIETMTHNSTDRNGTMSISEIRFEPVKRGDAGLYSCKGINVIGESAPANYRLDVQCNYYSTKIIILNMFYVYFFFFDF